MLPKLHLVLQCIPVYMFQHLWICVCVFVRACVWESVQFVRSVIYGGSLSAGCRGVSRCLHFPVIHKIYCQQVPSSYNYSLCFLLSPLCNVYAFRFIDSVSAFDTTDWYLLATNTPEWCLHIGWKSMIHFSKKILKIQKPSTKNHTETINQIGG